MILTCGFSLRVKIGIAFVYIACATMIYSDFISPLSLFSHQVKYKLCKRY